MEILRVATAGHVDHGKSTLLGRLVHDCGSLFQDQIDEVRENYSFAFDGLREEREQGKTIDVAYKFLTTPSKRIIVHDLPGHEDLLSNIATGLSVADVLILVIDASQGCTDLTYRYAKLSSLFRIEKSLFAITKMDIKGYSKASFDRGVKSLPLRGRAIPVSAVDGENITKPSLKMSWYEGPTLFEAITALSLSQNSGVGPVRFPVQRVSNGFCSGTVMSGTIRVGDELISYPSMDRLRILAINIGSKEVSDVSSPLSVTLVTHGEKVEVGALLVSPYQLPLVSASPKATLVTFEECKGSLTLQTIQGSMASEISSGVIRTRHPICYDTYATSKATGRFLLIEPETGKTLACGFFED